ncbi:MAG: YgiQ family radical SAM protein [Deltaproteobacteria bacterium]
MTGDWLVTSQADMEKRGWRELDIILVSGDAYVDHPAWASAILGRWLEKNGFRVGIIAQPRWDNLEDIRQLGRPRLMFSVSAGNMDSMINHYTADRHKRKDDAYSPGGKAGLRPDRATLVYCNLIRQAYSGVPLVIGGVEASLRRLAHYDYWSDKVRRSILLDSRADLLIYGMGEKNLLAVARRIAGGEDIKDVRDLAGTCYLTGEPPEDSRKLPSYEEVMGNPKSFARATRMILEENNPWQARALAQRHADRWVVQNPPPPPLSTEELDKYYALPFQRRAHPSYDKQGGVPALEPVQFSLASHRGCFGGCAFCALGLHQGKTIQSRSIDSLVAEARTFIRHPDFKGTIPDVGGPSANMYGMKGMDEDLCRVCRRTSCLFPRPCKNINADHSPSVMLWEALRGVKGLKNIFVASGLRYDLLLKDKSGVYLEELCRKHVGGQLKVAPEHINNEVTRTMHKSGGEVYQRFADRYQAVNRSMGREQYLIPYFMVGHPGCGLKESVELAEYVRDKLGHHPQQVQNFTPTPMTLSTCMYYTGLDPFSGEEVYVPRSEKERRQQRALLQYWEPEQADAVRDALKAAGRGDLIGRKAGCLVAPPEKETNPAKPGKGKANDNKKPTGNKPKKGGISRDRDKTKENQSGERGSRHTNRSAGKGDTGRGKGQRKPQR